MFTASFAEFTASFAALTAFFARRKAKFQWKEDHSHLLDRWGHIGSRSDSSRAPMDLSKEEFRRGRVGEQTAAPTLAFDLSTV